MRRFGVIGLPLLCVAALVAVLFGAVIWGGEQFGYRDAAHFYYPLYERVEQEWNAGRIPLWEAEENAGMPLVGNPTAAVLYPGKLIYRALPYAWGARLYVVAHVLLAAGAMFLLARHWGISGVGSTLAAMSYAFGTPVLFQYCNIIFLVGAAWTPLGLRAADRLLRQGKRLGMVELAIVLAMQTLGGDPQVAYVTGSCAAGYAAGLAWFRGRERLPSVKRVAIVTGLLAVVWLGLIFAAAYFLPGWYKAQGMDPALRAGTKLGPPSPDWIPAAWFPNRPGWTWLLTPSLVRRAFAILWGLLALAFLLRKNRGDRQTMLLRMGTALIAAAGLAFLLMGAQILPVMEYTSLSARASTDGPHEIFPFSMEPYRVAELFWPHFFGRNFGVNQCWMPFMPPTRTSKYWIPSLYVGTLTSLLALGAFRLRRVPSWQVWISVVGVVGLLLSFGETAGPLWIARAVPAVKQEIGRTDPPDTGEMRRDGFLIDATGSPYWVASIVLPGFHSFRYPSKLLVFSALALSVLAGAGWDGMTQRGERRASRLAAFLAIVSFLALIGVLVERDAILALWSQYKPENLQSSYGPFLPREALRDTRQSLAHGGIVALLAWGVYRLARVRPALAGGMAVVVMGVDLAVVMSPIIVTVPQAMFETRPEVLRIIEQAEADDPSPGPYRVHRMPMWIPSIWLEKGSPSRIAEFLAWERATMQPKYAIPFGVEYTFTEGTAEVFDYEFFFGPFYGNHGAELAKQLGLPPGEKAIYYPRRGFDLWNTRYFILPYYVKNDESRGVVSLLSAADLISPPTLTGDAAVQWAKERDWQVLRNRNAYPRAWVVHQGRLSDPVRGMGKAERQAVMEEILYQADKLWNSPDRVLYDPHQMAWIETDDRDSLGPFLTGGRPSSREQVKVRPRGPQRVELEAELDRPGIVVLADVFYPGWRLTIDGADATILRVNRSMRGALVNAGKHRLVYTYQPRSFRIGLVLSGCGMVVLLACIVWAWRRPDAIFQGTS